jgi:hypothetical protein
MLLVGHLPDHRDQLRLVSDALVGLSVCEQKDGTHCILLNAVLCRGFQPAEKEGRDRELWTLSAAAITGTTSAAREKR